LANQPFASSPYGKALFNVHGARKPTIGFMGHSYGAYFPAAVQYACARYYPADIEFNYSSYNASTNPLGRNFYVGGTTTGQMKTNQLPLFNANPTDLVFIWSGYNDGYADRAAAVAGAQNIIDTANSALANGTTKIAAVIGFGPKAEGSGGNNQAAWVTQTFNTVLQNYCAVTPGAVYVDAAAAMVDPTMSSANAASWTMWRGWNSSGSSNIFGSFTGDKTLPSAVAMRALAAQIWPILAMIARKRQPRCSINNGDFDRTNTPDANIFGAAGLMIGTDGALNGSNNTNVAGSWPSRWNIQSYGTTPASITPSIITGSDGFKRQRWTLGGTNVQEAYTQMGFFYDTPNDGVTSRLYDTEVVLELTGVTGVNDFVLNNPVPSANFTSGAPSNGYPDNTTETLFLYNLYPKTFASGGLIIGLETWFRNGSNPTGTIDVSRFSSRRVA
jgi:hypothetical protein